MDYDGYMGGYDGEICEMGDEEASVRRKISPRRDPAREVGDRDPWREEAEDLRGIAGRTTDAYERGKIEKGIAGLMAKSEEVDSLMSMMERHGDDYLDRRRYGLPAGSLSVNRRVNMEKLDDPA